MAYDLMDLLLLALYYQNIILRIVNILSENPADDMGVKIVFTLLTAMERRKL